MDKNDAYKLILVVLAILGILGAVRAVHERKENQLV